ncbi:phosphoglycerate dehydrogenase [uncultured Thomasclavelia sp.]|uniref:phosphoglycerate dehydrogenase n=1 Tax=uncultured Thomasclavelia sp. TaxID=3025759 RepID=UPI0025D75C37|nr:phosphoglycerate dehydrogenase [uncultured Thomasclavelia sp.]
MYNVKLINKISPVGLDEFDENYAYGEDIENEDAILVRSASLHDYDFNPNLKAIARAGAGVNNIPIDKCTENGIVVFNTPGANANAVKELVICSLFLASRKVIESHEWINGLKDEPDVANIAEKGKNNFIGPEIEGKTLGVIGLGSIGVSVANAAIKLNMKVKGYDPYIRVDAAWALSKHAKQAASLEEIYKECDYITIHVPSTKETRGSLNKEAFALMKDGVRILNFARGDLVNNEDLLAAIASGKVGKYISDFAAPELLGKENIIIFPHLGASTPESEDNCAKMAVSEVREYLENGNIINSVNFPGVKQARESKTRICVINKNVPNILARISNLFADHNLNIENMVNRSRGVFAYTLIDTNDEVRQDIVDRIKSAKGVISVRVIAD